MTPVDPTSHVIFLSGTNLDLKDYKSAALGVFVRLKLHCKQQMDFQQTGLGTDARQWSEDLMKGTDWYVLIVASRYGEVVNDPETRKPFSVTEMEYRQAGKTSKRRFVFMSDPAKFRDALAMNQRDTLPTGGQDFDKARQLQDFRSTLTAAHTVVDFFEDLGDFRLKLERALGDVLKSEREELQAKLAKDIIDKEILITNRFNALLARKKELLSLVMDLDERFRLNQTRLTGVTLLKNMHDGIHIARQEAIRPLREVTFPEWKRDGLTDAVLRQLKSARRTLLGLLALNVFYDQFGDAVAQIVLGGDRFSDSRAQFSHEMQAFFQASDFAAGVADYHDLTALQLDLQRFVVVLEKTFSLLNSEFKLGADMLGVKNKDIEAAVETALLDPGLQLSEADVKVVRDRISLLQARTGDLRNVIRGHDDWQEVHERLTEVDGCSGSAGHAEQIMKDVCSGRVHRQLHRLVSERCAQLRKFVVQQYAAVGSTAPQSQASPYWQLREVRRAIQRNELKAANAGDARLTYLKRYKCEALTSQLARLLALQGRPSQMPEWIQAVETTYAAARQEFDDQFFDVDKELSLLCAELSRKVNESLAAMRQIDLAAS